MNRHLPLGSALLLSTLLWLSGCSSGSGDDAKVTSDLNATAAQRRAQGKSDLSAESNNKRSDFATNKANSDPLLRGASGTYSAYNASRGANGQAISSNHDYNGGSTGGFSIGDAAKTAAVAGGAALLAGTLSGGKLDLGNVIPAKPELPAKPDTSSGKPNEQANDQVGRSSGPGQKPSGDNRNEETKPAETHLELVPPRDECFQHFGPMDQQLADAMKAMDEAIEKLSKGE